MSRPLRVVFAGTPQFAVPCLQACLDSDVEVVAVYTQPDRRAGRGRHLAASPVKQAALAADLAVEQPVDFRDAGVRAVLADHAPDLLVVVAYGLILPQTVLDTARLDAWNVHASLLPRWRGAAPIQRAIAAGDTHTGVCLMRMEAGLDTGPVLLRESVEMDAGETAASLHDRLADLGAQVLRRGLAMAVDGKLPEAQPQPSQGVTYAHKLDKAEALLDWQQPAAVLERQVRAFNPFPIAVADVEGEQLRIHAAQLVTADTQQAAPGTVLSASAAGLDVATAEGVLRITRLQRPGGKPMDVAAWLNARRSQARAP